MDNDSYVTTFCKKAHRLSDGKPIEHKCGIIPPAALQAERDGDAQKARELIEKGKTRNNFGVRNLPGSNGVPAKK